MAINPNAGNFSNLNKVGAKHIQPKTPAPSGPKDGPSVQQDPSESVKIGFQPMADSRTDSVGASVEKKTESTPAAQATPSRSSIPSQVGNFNIAGVSNTGSVQKLSFPGLSLNGLGATSFETLSGRTVATVNPLKPMAPVPLPTTSVGMNGIGSSSFAFTSGREVTL